MSTDPTSNDFGAGGAVGEQRIDATRMVVEFPNLFRTVERGT